MKLLRYAVIIVIVLTFGITLALWPAVPDTIVSHWNAAGDANGTMAKFWGLILIPLIMSICVGLFMLIPVIDPLRQNYETFRDYYEGFILVFCLYLLAIQLQLILWNTGFKISPTLTFPVLAGLLFIYIGFLLGHAEPNWFVGIRTPWTLSSENVWRKTHLLGGKLFKIAGIISIAGVLAGRYAIWFTIVPVIAVAVYTVVYSYREFGKEPWKTG